MPAKQKRAKNQVWSPNPGPQSALFLCPAEIILFGGAKGGGKCMLPEHEVLTREGWKRVDQLVIGEEVVSWYLHKISKKPELRWEKIAAVYVRDYDGRILRHETRPYFAVTEDHRWFTSYGIGRDKIRKKRWTVKRSHELTSGMSIPASGVPLVGETEKFSGDELELWGWYLAEGSPPQNGLARFSQVKQFGRERIVQLAKKLSLKVVVYEREIRILWEPPIPCGEDCYSKFIPRELVTEKYRSRLLQGMLGGDGWYRREGWELYSTSEKMIDTAQEIATLEGWRVIKRVKKIKSDFGKCWVAAAYPRQEWFLSGPKLKWEHFKGKTYCIWLPQSGAFLTRYRGSVCVTGNSDGMLVWAAQDIDKNDYRAIIFRRTYPELEKHIIPRSQQLFGGIGRYDSKNHRWNFRTADGGRSSIEFAYLERESDIFSYQGSQYAKVGFDESTLFSENSVRLMWTCVRSMVPNIRKQMLLTSNPVGPGFGWHKLMFIKGRENRKIYRDAVWPSDRRPVGATTCFIQSRVYDNYALLRNDPGYIDRLKSQSLAVTKALLEGSWEETLHMAFSFDPYVHSCLPFDIPADCPRWMGLDWGKEDKAATVWYTYYKGRVYAYRDHCRPGKLIIPYAQEVVDLSKGESIEYCVLSHECFSQHGTGNTQADQFIKVFSKAGIPVVKSDKDAEGRLMLMREYLRTTKVPTSEADVGIAGDYRYWMERFNKEGVQAWKDFRQFGDNDEAKLPKLQIFQPGVLKRKLPNGEEQTYTVGCPDLLQSLPLLTTDIERPKMIAENQDDHAYDGASYGLKAFVANDEQSLMEAYEKQLQGRVPDSLLAAHHALEAAKDSLNEEGFDDKPLKWNTPSYGDEDRDF